MLDHIRPNGVSYGYSPFHFNCTILQYFIRRKLQLRTFTIKTSSLLLETSTSNVYQTRKVGDRRRYT